MQINFSEIPGFSNLFLDYLYEFDNCKVFFNKYFRDTDKYENQFKNRITPDDTLRVKLRSIISEQYSLRNPSKLTIQNINSIENEKTIIIISEVQPFLFGGPLSVVYKIISAIKLSQKLKEDFDEFNFIPILWIEEENASLSEITNFTFTDKNNSLITLHCKTDEREAEHDTTAGIIRLKNEIAELVNKFSSLSPRTDFSDDVVRRLVQSYKSGATFTEAFSQYAFRLFDEYGLVIFNPSDKEVKKLLAPVFRQELINFREHAEKLVETTAALDDIYSADEKLVPLNLYLTVESRRFLIEPAENQFRLHTKRKRISEEEILAILKEEPERISPSSLLLPVCQNYLFQTGFRIADAAEISRLAQSERLYYFYDVEPPFIYPAISATLLEEQAAAYIRRNDLQLQTIFISKTESGDETIVNAADTLDELFNDAKVDIAEILAGLEEQLSLTDNDSGGEIRIAAKQTAELLEFFRDKIKLSQRQKTNDKNKQLEEIKTAIYPAGSLHERKVATISFLNKYGTELIKILFSKLSVTKTEHQIIEI
ncbi:MAG: bacillithiol biosynthesis cysteine-adding enzyme BshC [Chlorobi bacterium]|nr:bacillithiol biosynthesis cysteine-adding enzyme BshC [Chlorobiota bacterium]